MSEQLWTDERITQRLSEIKQKLRENARNRSGPKLYTVPALEQLVEEMRDDFQQRIEELEAQVVKLEHNAKRNINGTVKDLFEICDDAKADVKRLEAENARLRALLPGPEVISAIRDVIDGWEHSGLDEYHGSPRHAYDSESVVKVEAWLDSIEAEKEAGDG